MWPSWLCGLPPVEAKDSALSRLGTPHNLFLADSDRPVLAGARDTGDDRRECGSDRPIRTSLRDTCGVDGPASGNAVEGGRELGGLRSDPGTQGLMWRSAGGPFEETA